MKRLVFLIIIVILTSGIAMSQNANRHGFFLEAGIGGIVGSTPRTSISIVDNAIYYKCLSGAAFDFGLGGRFRIGKHWAYEIKAEAQIPFANPINALVGRALPIGFRYTSLELWRNYSIYTHFNLGGAITVNSGMVGRDNLIINAENATNSQYVSYGYGSNILFPNMPATDIKGYVGLEGYGIAYSAGVGINITPHLYLEGCINAQTLFSCYGKYGRNIINYGLISCVMGYRF